MTAPSGRQNRLMPVPGASGAQPSHPIRPVDCTHEREAPVRPAPRIKPSTGSNTEGQPTRPGFGNVTPRKPPIIPPPVKLPVVPRTPPRDLELVVFFAAGLAVLIGLVKSFRSIIRRCNPKGHKAGPQVQIHVHHDPGKQTLLLSTWRAHDETAADH
jgi:hypothetical protein